MSLPVRDFLSDKLPSAHEIKEKLTEAGTWVWEHKKWIIMAACATGGLVLVVKKRSDISRVLGSFVQTGPEGERVFESVVEEKIPLVPNSILERRTGVMLTATKLGSKAGVSNREINRRLVDAGLCTRLPCGDYVLTEEGKQLGKIDLVVRSWGKTVPLIQWDKVVLDIIFSQDERTEIEERQRYFQEILNQTST